MRSVAPILRNLLTWAQQALVHYSMELSVLLSLSCISNLKCTHWFILAVKIGSCQHPLWPVTTNVHTWRLVVVTCPILLWSQWAFLPFLLSAQTNRHENPILPSSSSSESKASSVYDCWIGKAHLCRVYTKEDLGSLSNSLLSITWYMGPYSLAWSFPFWAMERTKLISDRILLPQNRAEIVIIAGYFLNSKCEANWAWSDYYSCVSFLAITSHAVRTNMYFCSKRIRLMTGWEAVAGLNENS